jgi:hypothetical protein
MKTCSKCKVEKPFEEFSKHKNRKDGLSSECKNCNKIYREENKEKIKEVSKKYFENNKKKLLELGKQYRENNKEKLLEQKKIYYKNNKEKILENNKKYYKINKEKVDSINKNYQKERKKIDPLFKFRGNVRSLVLGSFKRGKNQFSKNAKTETILGCAIEEFRNYIKSKFTKGMTLENHGEWHLDHIIPLATATTEEEIIKLNHYTNFQPLWAEDNLSKGDKIIDQQLKLL